MSCARKVRLGEALFFLGRREEAQEVLEEALRLARQLGAPLSPVPRQGAARARTFHG